LRLFKFAFLKDDDIFDTGKKKYEFLFQSLLNSAIKVQQEVSDYTSAPDLNHEHKVRVYVSRYSSSHSHTDFTFTSFSLEHTAEVHFHATESVYLAPNFVRIA